MLRLRNALFVAFLLPTLAVACGNPQSTAAQTAELAASSSPATSATATPATGLTDTGYTALDGRPLYAECVETGLPMPPVYPPGVQANGTPIAAPSAIASSEVGDATPAPADVPGFDPLAVPTPDISSWPSESSACMRLAYRIPPGTAQVEPLTVHGYQQEATASMSEAGRRVVFELHLFTTPADLIGLARASHVAEREYRFVNDRPVQIGGADGVVRYGTEPNGFKSPEVAITYIVSPYPSWYLQITGFFSPEYAEDDFALFAGSRVPVRSVSNRSTG